jgi:SAM-dependent methyltransferase
VKDSEQTKTWYSSLAGAHTSEQRKTWYSSVADAYNRVRPRYPQELINRAVELAQLASDAQILELGCGPGIATVPFAQLGFSMVCLEPSQESCQLARLNCAQYPNVDILNTTFEEWQLENERFNAVIAATSFHWISPEIAASKSAAALAERGSMILLWNTAPQPAYEVYAVLREVYETWAPAISGYEDIATQEENLKRQSQVIIDSGLFEGFVWEQLLCDVTYSIDDYLALLSTLSPYIRLDRQQRDSLFAGLRSALEKHCGNSLQTSYLSVLQIAQKI